MEGRRGRRIDSLPSLTPETPTTPTRAEPSNNNGGRRRTPPPLNSGVPNLNSERSVPTEPPKENFGIDDLDAILGEDDFNIDDDAFTLVDDPLSEEDSDGDFQFIDIDDDEDGSSEQEDELLEKLLGEFANDDEEETSPPPLQDDEKLVFNQEDEELVFNDDYDTGEQLVFNEDNTEDEEPVSASASDDFLQRMREQEELERQREAEKTNIDKTITTDDSEDEDEEDDEEDYPALKKLNKNKKGKKGKKGKGKSNSNVKKAIKNGLIMVVVVLVLFTGISIIRGVFFGKPSKSNADEPVANITIKVKEIDEQGRANVTIKNSGDKDITLEYLTLYFQGTDKVNDCTAFDVKLKTGDNNDISLACSKPSLEVNKKQFMFDYDVK